MASEDFLSRDQCKHAVETLLAHTAKEGPALLGMDADVKVYLQLSFKKAPSMKPKTIKLKLPNPLSTVSTEVCLFVKDLDKRDKDFKPTAAHFKDLLARQNVKCISQVIPLKSLKLEYRPFEAKRNLANMFDVHLADERIMHLLPAILGKNFYHKKKQPIPVNLKAMNLKKEIEDATGSSRCILTGRGSCSSAAVALGSMSVDQVVDNIVAATKALVAALPGGAPNIKTMHVKQLNSIALPIYVSLSPDDDVVLPQKKRIAADEEPEEITTLSKAKVKVSRLGNVTVISEDAPDASKPTAGKGKRRRPATASTKGPRPKVAKKSAKRSLSEVAPPAAAAEPVARAEPAASSELPAEPPAAQAGSHVDGSAPAVGSKQKQRAAKPPAARAGKGRAKQQAAAQPRTNVQPAAASGTKRKIQKA